MKIILSRKGFDSTTDGNAERVCPRRGNGEFSDSGDSGKTTRDRPGLDSLRHILREGNVVAGANEGAAGEWRPLRPNGSIAITTRICGAAFLGKAVAQTHLQKRVSQKGDLFLFFGWFREAEAGWRRFALFQSPAGCSCLVRLSANWGNFARGSRRAKYPICQNHPHLTPHAIGAGQNPNARKGPKTTPFTSSRQAPFASGHGRPAPALVFSAIRRNLSSRRTGAKSRTIWEVARIFRNREIHLTIRLILASQMDCFQSRPRGRNALSMLTPEIQSGRWNAFAPECSEI